MNNPNNQLPDEVILQIEEEAADKYPCTLENHEHRNNVQRYRVGYMAGATEYATKLHQAQQDNTVLSRAIETHKRSYDAKSKDYDELYEKLEAAEDLLKKFISRHEAGLLPDMFIYNEIKQYLDGKNKYTPCGGCGATDPMQRCIGCFHPFEPFDVTIERLNAQNQCQQDKNKKASEAYAALRACADKMEQALNKIKSFPDNQWHGKAIRKIITEALEHEPAEQPTIPQQGAVWVKASERLPKRDVDVIVRNFNTGRVKKTASFGHNKGWDVAMDREFMWDNTEWLDEGGEKEGNV